MTKFPCGYCQLVLNSLKNQQGHIETSHVRQKTSDGQAIKACEYCGVVLSRAS